MLAFIESIIKLLVNWLFVDRLSKNNEELRAEVQKLTQEKKEQAQKEQQLEEKNQKLIRTNFNLVKKYIALNQEKEELARKLERYESPRLDINQQFNPEDLNILDQLLQDTSSSEELTI